MKQVVSLLALCITALLSVWLVTESQKKSGVIDAIEARRSIRAYKDTPVEREKLQLLAECGVLAPSAMNRQEWEVRIVDSKEWIDGCSAAYLKAVEGTGKADYLLKPGFKNIFRKNFLFAEISVNAVKVHAGLDFNNLKHIHSGIHEIRKQRLDKAAGMHDDRHFSRMRMIKCLLMSRENQFLIHSRGHKGASLVSHIFIIPDCVRHAFFFKEDFLKIQNKV